MLDDQPSSGLELAAIAPLSGFHIELPPKDRYWNGAHLGVVMHESQDRLMTGSNTPTSRSVTRAALAGRDRSGRVADDDDGLLLFPAFLACRTTLENLSDRTAALGESVSGALIAAHLTGKSSVSEIKHNAVADAINARLGELSLPAVAPHRGGDLH